VKFLITHGVANADDIGDKSDCQQFRSRLAAVGGGELLAVLRKSAALAAFAMLD